MEYQSKQKIIVVIIILAAATAGALWFQPDILTLLKPRSAAPAAGQPARPPVPPQEKLISGNVIGISLEKQEITLGTYRVEGGKAVPASQATIAFSAATVFVREAPAPGGKLGETAIASRDVRMGDLVRITTGGTGRAEKVVILSLPPPPAL